MQAIYQLIEKTRAALAANADARRPQPDACAQIVAFSKTWHQACNTTQARDEWHRYIELIAESAVTRGERARARLISQALEAALLALQAEVRHLRSAQARPLDPRDLY